MVSPEFPWRRSDPGGYLEIVGRPVGYGTPLHLRFDYNTILRWSEMSLEAVEREFTQRWSTFQYFEKLGL